LAVSLACALSPIRSHSRRGIMTSARRAAPLVGLLCAMLAFGQSGMENSPTGSSKTQAPPTLSVDVDLVLLNAAVTDSQNRHVTGLGKENFQMCQDKTKPRSQKHTSHLQPLTNPL